MPTMEASRAFRARLGATWRTGKARRRDARTRGGTVKAQGGDTRGGGTSTSAKLVGAAATVTALVVAATNLPSEWIEDIVYGDVYSVQDDGMFTAGAVASSLLWTVSLYYASPLQAVLLFLGKIDQSRPSDGVQQILGKWMGYDVTRVEYEAPGIVRVATASVFLVAGTGVTASLRALTEGDTTWAVSVAIGFAMVAGVYELGRPARLSRVDAERLERMWQDFRVFADENLQDSGRCHVSEVEKRFRTSSAKYRSKESCTDTELRNLIANWAPQADRTPSGYYKGLSLRPRIDPFQ